MRLLVITQTVDKNDPILGFFHGWLESLAKEVDSLEVIGLSVGDHNLPENVTVHSLGKELGQKSSLVYLWRLWRLGWQRREHYDVVLVHMNPEYVLGGAPIFVMLRKPVTMWYAHGTVSLRLRVATWFSKLIFTSTEQGFRLPSKKRRMIGQGIDVEKFKPREIKEIGERWRLFIVGRIARSKHLDTLIKAVAILKEQEFRARLTIAGVAKTKEEEKYQEELTSLIKSLGLQNEVFLVGPILNNDLPTVLNHQDILVSDGSTGSLDKVLVEAMASGLMVISSNAAFEAVTPNKKLTTFKAHDAAALAEAVVGYSHLKEEKKRELKLALRDEVVKNHSLKAFSKKIISECNALV